VERSAPRRRPARRIERAHDEPAFVLHAHAWRETSLILDVFSRHHGRLPLVAKGAKRPHSQLRTVLLGFAPFAASWSGQGEVRTLTRAEWTGGVAPLAGLPLLCGFYFNELLMRLLPREDPHEALFDAYLQALTRLGEGAGTGGAAAPARGPLYASRQQVEPLLRGFEMELLRELGHLPELHLLSASGEPVRPQGLYVVDPQRGVLEHVEQDASTAMPGEQLLAIADARWEHPGALRGAKSLMRELLGYHLGTQPLRTRQLLIDLHQL
jgi:DNA repair protein RecO (recombination protein O)